MIGADTNVLVRLLLDDDAVQTETARAFLERGGSAEPVFISTVVVAELVLVLLLRYRLPRDRVSEALGVLLGSPSFFFEQAEAVEQAVEGFRASGADFADCLIAALGQAARCKYTVTFDRNASGVPGMRLLS